MDSYYSNLLILQYHNKPKAKATVEAVTSVLPDELIQEVNNGFSVDTAVGKQLDTLGSIVGVDRSYIDEDEYKLLNDDDFRILIKLKIISNSSNFSHKSIDDALYDFFGNEIRMDSTGNMEMTYFVPKGKTNLILAAIQKEVLPRPMGVRVAYINEYDKKFLGFCTYANQQAIYKTGFRDYNNPDKVGEMLTYSKRVDF
jgi:hypothetical protein